MATITGPKGTHGSHGWWLNDDVWNAGSLVYGRDYTVSTTYNPADLQQGVEFDWSFPVELSSVVRASPNITYGPDPNIQGRDVANTSFPIQMSQLNSFNVNYNVGISGNTNGFAVGFEIWVTSQPDGGQNSITNQIMVWVHHGSLSPQGHVIGSYTDPSHAGISGNLWEASVHTPGGGNWQETTLVTNTDQLSGQIDLTALLDKLETLHILSGSSYISDIELGAGVAFSQGSLVVNSFSLATSVGAATAQSLNNQSRTNSSQIRQSTGPSDLGAHSAGHATHAALSEADGGSSSADASSSAAAAAVTDLAALHPIASGETLEISSAWAGPVTFAAPTGTLVLYDSLSFTGSVTGMTGRDTLDLRDLNPGAVQTPTYLGTSSAGTLTVSDGIHTANIALSGDYLGSTFVASSDGHGGTSVIESLITAHYQMMLMAANHYMI
jgi:hypothetical protein